MYEHQNPRTYWVRGTVTKEKTRQAGKQSRHKGSKMQKTSVVNKAGRKAKQAQRKQNEHGGEKGFPETPRLPVQ